MITDPKRNFKASIGSTLLFPKVSLIDPELALHLPYQIAASTGMDTLTHGIETYVSKRAQPITEAISFIPSAWFRKICERRSKEILKERLI
jgi:alcohol dehydrogenase class IV